jgi:hypothetical protein
LPAIVFTLSRVHCRRLKNCPQVSTVDLSCNDLKASGALRVSQLLLESRYITSIDLSRNLMLEPGLARDTRGALALAEAIGECPSLRTVSLAHNGFGSLAYPADAAGARLREAAAASSKGTTGSSTNSSTGRQPQKGKGKGPACPPATSVAGAAAGTGKAGGGGTGGGGTGGGYGGDSSAEDEFLAVNEVVRAVVRGLSQSRSITSIDLRGNGFSMEEGTGPHGLMKAVKVHPAYHSTTILLPFYYCNMA